MTTAARPTFDPAKGGSGVKEKSLGKLSQQLSSRDLPAHLTLKERIPGQDTIDEVNARDLRSELEERERIAQLEKSQGNHYKFVPSIEQATQVRLALKAERDKEREAEKNALLEGDLDSQKFPNIINARKMAQLDADEDFGDADFSESDFEDDDDDEEDDPRELMAELEKIKQERLAEEAKRERDQKDKEDQRSILDEESSFAIKRRWDDDVPFKNCAREEPDPKRKLYVNDTLRQDFHKKFMDKYIRWLIITNFNNNKLLHSHPFRSVA